MGHYCNAVRNVSLSELFRPHAIISLATNNAAISSVSCVWHLTLRLQLTARPIIDDNAVSLQNAARRNAQLMDRKRLVSCQSLSRDHAAIVEEIIPPTNALTFRIGSHAHPVSTKIKNAFNIMSITAWNAMRWENCASRRKISLTKDLNSSRKPKQTNIRRE